MATGLKQEWQQLRKGRAGHRFQERAERARKNRHRQSWLRRWLYPAIGVLVFVAGIVFCIIPGPGLPLVFLGAALLAERSWRIARVLDWAELKLRYLFRWGKGWWRRASLVARNAVLVLAALVMAGAGYGAYQIFIDR